MSCILDVIEGIRMAQPVTTIAYPYERQPVNAMDRGMVMLVVDEAGHPICIACCLCHQYCPAQAISLLLQYSATRIQPELFIDYNRCIFCGLCISICPVEAILHTNITNLSYTTYSMLLHDTRQLYNHYL